MKKIIIIGAGFAGLSSLAVLSKNTAALGLNLTLINDKDRFSFLPMLPDCLGRGIDPNNLAYDLRVLNRKKNVSFIKDRVLAIDLENREIRTTALKLDYDFLIIASGSETNFYGNKQIQEYAFKLDDVRDASLIAEALRDKSYENYLIAGGGYTGIEVATSLRRYFKKSGLRRKIIILERAPSVLGSLPAWMKEYVLDNLHRLDIDVLVNSGIASLENRRVKLSDGRVFNGSMLIWAAGVKTSDFIQDLKVDKNHQGRIKVDEFLRVNNSCFAAGDSGYFMHKDNFLRMAVQFAIKEGFYAAVNIKRIIAGKSLIRYRPLDLGYVIPMANNRSCGIILGIKMKGLLPTLMHYLMCLYRSRNFKNRIGIISDLIRSRYGHHEIKVRI
jgi:NADH dehydrogenase